MTDFLEQKRKEIQDRIDVLRPLVDEYHRLQQAAGALGGPKDGAENGGTASRQPGARRRGPGRPKGSRGAKATAATPAAKPAGKAAAKANATGGRPGRKKGTGGRAAQALAAVQAQPGISIPDLATQIGIKPSYLYSVLPALEKEKKVRKDGRGWYPVAAAAAV